MITIVDMERPEYLDGAQMQFAVFRGDQFGEVIAYCNSIEDARKIAHAFAEADESVVITRS